MHSFYCPQMIRRSNTGRYARVPFNFSCACQSFPYCFILYILNYTCFAHQDLYNSREKCILDILFPSVRIILFRKRVSPRFMNKAPLLTSKNRYKRTPHNPRQETRMPGTDTQLQRLPRINRNEQKEPLVADGDHHQDKRSSGKKCNGPRRTEGSKTMPPRRARPQIVAIVRSKDQVFTRNTTGGGRAPQRSLQGGTRHPRTPPPSTCVDR